MQKSDHCKIHTTNYNCALPFSFFSIQAITKNDSQLLFDWGLAVPYIWPNDAIFQSIKIKESKLAVHGR